MSLADLAAWTNELAERLPPVRRVFGVARSGMIPAATLSACLGAELWSLNQNSGEIVHLGTGTRMIGVELGEGADLVVDDSAWTGGSMRKATAILRRHGIEPIRAAIITSPKTDPQAIDLAAVSIDNHLFAWNASHAPWSHTVAFDIDGLFCRDFTAEEDDDGPRYLAAMQAMRPNLWRSKKPLHFVTARLEKYRSPTVAWLESIGQPIASLSIGPWDTIEDRSRDDVPAWKAERIKALGLGLFIDSSDYVARRVNELIGVPSAATDSGRFYLKKPSLPPDLLTRRVQCSHRGPSVESVPCSGCWSKGHEVEVPVYSCAIHGRAHTLRVKAPASKIGRPCWLCEDAVDSRQL